MRPLTKRIEHLVVLLCFRYLKRRLAGLDLEGDLKVKLFDFRLFPAMKPERRLAVTADEQFISILATPLALFLILRSLRYLPVGVATIAVVTRVRWIKNAGVLPRLAWD